MRACILAAATLLLALTGCHNLNLAQGHGNCGCGTTCGGNCAPQGGHHGHGAHGGHGLFGHHGDGQQGHAHHGGGLLGHKGGHKGHGLFGHKGWGLFGHHKPAAPAQNCGPGGCGPDGYGAGGYGAGGYAAGGAGGAGYAPHLGPYGTPGFPKHGYHHHDREYTGPQGPATAQVGYPYYTTRGPRDFLLDNPPSIGR